MPIFATSEVGLYHLTDILHDLYFPLPENGFDRTDDGVRITFTDEECILKDDGVSQFELEIHDIQDIEFKGQLSDCPDPIQFNKFKYNAKNERLVLHSVHPLKVVFVVRRLHLSLNQTA